MPGLLEKFNPFAATQERLERKLREARDNFHRNDEKIIALIRRGVATELKDSYGRTLLLAEMIHGNPDIIAALIEKGANLNATDASGDNALMYAIREKNGDALKALLDAGADTGMKNHAGQTALEMAAQEGRKQCVEILLNAGVKPDTTIFGGSAREWKEDREALWRKCLGHTFIRTGGKLEDLESIEQLIAARAAEKSSAQKEYDDYLAKGMPLKKDLGVIEPLKCRETRVECRAPRKGAKHAPV